MSDQPTSDPNSAAGGSPPPPPPPQPPWPDQQYGAPPPGYGQGYGPQGYGPQWQQPGYPQPQTQSTNGMAVAAMVLGILWIWWIGSILALIFGYISKKQIDESQGRQSGRGMAIAGIALGWVGVGFLLLGLAFGFAGALMGV